MAEEDVLDLVKGETAAGKGDDAVLASAEVEATFPGGAFHLRAVAGFGPVVGFIGERRFDLEDLVFNPGFGAR